MIRTWVRKNDNSAQTFTFASDEEYRSFLLKEAKREMIRADMAGDDMAKVAHMRKAKECLTASQFTPTNAFNNTLRAYSG